MNVRNRNDSEHFVRRMADYEKVSGVLWLLLAIVQIFAVVTIIAGLWNLFAAFSRFGMARRIRERDTDVPREYEGIAQLIIIAVINLLFGAVFGVVFVALDFYIRDKILSNRHVFEEDSINRVSAWQAGAFGQETENLDCLQRLYGLHKRGILTTAEYESQKRRILNQ